MCVCGGQISREQREPLLWIKVPASLSTPGPTLTDTSAHYRQATAVNTSAQELSEKNILK